MANPGFTLDSLTKDRTSRPPTKRTIRLNATCMTTNGRMARARADVTPAARLQGGHRLDARRAQRRSEPEQRAAQHRHPADERDEAPVDAQVEQHGIVRRPEHAHDCRRRDHREHHADEACGAGDERAFDEHLLDQAAAAGPQREAQRHLVLTRRGPREEQVRDVRTGDEQHQRGDPGENPQRPLKPGAERRRTGRRGSYVERRVDELRDAIGRSVRRRNCRPRRHGGSS